MANSKTPPKKKNSQTTNKAKPERHVVQLSEQLKTLYYAVWSVVGLTLLVLISVAVFGSDSWVENLNISDIDQAPEQAQTQQPQAQPQQPPQPTEEQLSCVSDEVGEDRLAELEQGSAATQEESLAIQECLQL